MQVIYFTIHPNVETTLGTQAGAHLVEGVHLIIKRFHYIINTHG